MTGVRIGAARSSLLFTLSGLLSMWPALLRARHGDRPLAPIRPRVPALVLNRSWEDDHGEAEP